MFHVQLELVHLQVAHQIYQLLDRRHAGHLHVQTP
jgi:hypothetical protein